MRTITEEQYQAIRAIIRKINRHMMDEWDDYYLHVSAYFKWEPGEKKLIHQILNLEDFAKKELKNEQ